MLERLKNSKVAKKIGIVVASVAMLAVSMFSASAEAPAVSTPAMSETLISSFGGVTSDLTATITGILPYVLGLVALGLAITLGIKYFKKFAGKAG